MHVCYLKLCYEKKSFAPLLHVSNGDYHVTAQKQEFLL